MGLLLRCTNRNCRNTVNHQLESAERLWNRDMAACLNMLNIIQHLHQDGSIPAIFSRQ
ncbi:MAG: hypothetical protein EXX96DRAFT_559842 [Benjaminiella poitrasii]|nr:MAG: hypothetical protein EXX96DRAFT_559842 [Benjaminiella poitrasii]